MSSGAIIFAAAFCSNAAEQPPPPPQRLVFSLTTTTRRIDQPALQSVVTRLVKGQTRQPDAVYLAIPPTVKNLPAWLTAAATEWKGTLRILRMKRDYGPASKLISALVEGGEKSASTVVIYCDDDVLYSSKVATVGTAGAAALDSRLAAAAGPPRCRSTRLSH